MQDLRKVYVVYPISTDVIKPPLRLRVARGHPGTRTYVHIYIHRGTLSSIGGARPNNAASKQVNCVNNAGAIKKKSNKKAILHGNKLFPHEVYFSSDVHRFHNTFLNFAHALGYSYGYRGIITKKCGDNIYMFGQGYQQVAMSKSYMGDYMQALCW